MAECLLTTGNFYVHDLIRRYLTWKWQRRTSLFVPSIGASLPAAGSKTKISEVTMPNQWIAARELGHTSAKFLLAVLVSLSVLMPGAASGQNKKMIRIGVTKIVSNAALDADEKGFEAALASARFTEGV